MKDIRIWFCDVWGWFDINDNFIINALNKKYNVILDKKNPDYLFYSVCGCENLKYNCVKIFHTQENIFPDFNMCDYAIGFHEFKLKDRYLSYPLFVQTAVDEKLYEKKYDFKKEDLESKNRFCNFIYSNKKGCIQRKKFFEKLNNYKKVDSAGGFLNNIGYAIKDKREFQKQCKFTIAFENESYKEYCTEKIIDAFLANTIPIYYGDENIEKYINEKCFINCKNYKSFEDVIEKVKQIDNDDDLYIKMLNEPVFKDEKYLKQKEKELEDFLFNIIEKGNQILRPASYQAKLNKAVLIIGMPIIHLKHKFHKYKKRIKRKFLK